MHFIDKIDFIAAARWAVLDIVQQLSHIIDAGARGGIHLNQIHKSAVGDLFTTGALTTGGGTDTLLTV